MRGASPLQPDAYDPPGLRADPPLNLSPGWKGSGHVGSMTARRAAGAPSAPSRRLGLPSAPSSLRAASVGALEGGRARRGRRNLCMTFPRPHHSAPSVPHLPGEDGPPAPPPSGWAGGRRRRGLKGASGAGGLRCGRDLPKSTPRSQLRWRSAPSPGQGCPPSSRKKYRRSVGMRDGPARAGHGGRARDDNFLRLPGGSSLAAVVDHARGLTPRASGGGQAAPPATLTRGRSGWSGPSKTPVVCSLKKGGRA